MIEYYNQLSHLLSSVCSESIVHSFHSIMVFDILSNCEGCPIRPSEAKPHPTLQQVGDSLGEAKVFG